MSAAAATKRLLVTGATGKVGRAAIARLLADPRLVDAATTTAAPADDPRIVWYPG